jgi:kynurenine formamidase
MRTVTWWVGLLIGVAVFASGCRDSTSTRAGWPDGDLVDLSHSYDPQTIYWPTSDRFRLDIVTAGMTDQGYYYSANNFFTAEHGGTHIDAPVHFAEKGLSVDRLPLSRLIGEAVVVSVVEKSGQNPDYQVTVDDFRAWEGAHGSIPPDRIVLIRTGFSSRWPDAARYLGTAERGPEAVAQLHFPGLHPDAARWLLEERRIKAVGIDTASIDYGQSTLYETHRLLAARDVPAFENLTALEALPPTGATVVALPVKIGGGTGGPLRAIAFVPRSGS